MIRRLVTLACCASLLWVSGPAQAVTTQDLLNQVTNTVGSDATLLSGWLADQLKNTVAFNSTSGNVVPNQLKVFGVEVGAEGVVSGTKIDVDSFHALPTTLVNPRSVDMFSRFPMPLILGHAKVGLPWGFDGGLRFGGIPKTTIDSHDSKGKIENKVFGVDLRKKIIEEGMTKPFGLTLGVNYTHAKGSMDLTTTFDSLSYGFDYGGSAHTATLSNGTAVSHSEWKTDSYGVQALLDKKILFMTPYIGASANYNTGDIRDSLTASGTPTIDGSALDPVSAGATSSVKPNHWDLRGLLGLEFSLLPFMKLGIGGEYAGSRNVAGSLGLRVQFR